MEGAAPPRTIPHQAIAALLVTAVCAAFYVPTMNRTVGFIDRGELAAVAVTLGIAHPTGYPTFTLLGHLWTKLLPLPPVLALNLLAALWAACGAGALTLLYDGILGRLAAPPAPRAGLAACGALLTALGTIWWSQANGFEVYALQALLLPLTLWLFVRWLALDTFASGATFAFVLGLTFTNHMTIVLLAPALLFLHFARRGFRAASWRRLASLIAPFALGLTPYLYLPIRAAQHPRFNWNEPADLHHFLRHVAAREFQGWMFEGGDTFARQLRWFASHLPDEWAYVGLALIALGVWRLARADRALAVALVLLIATCVAYAANYGIRDITPYFLTAVVGLGAFATAGLWAVKERAGLRAALAVGLLAAGASAALHRGAVDESRTRWVEDAAVRTLTPLPANALLLTTQWDYLYSGALYLQTVQGLRPDVTAVDLLLLRNRWYLDALVRRAPALMREVAGEAIAYRTELAPYEAGRPYDGARIQAAYSGLIAAMIERRVAAGAFVTGEVEPAIGAPYTRVPYHLAFRLVADTAYVSQERGDVAPSWRGVRPDPYVATATLLRGQSHTARMEYERAHGRVDAAGRELREALAFAPPWDAATLPVLPYDGGELVGQALGFFARLKAYAGTAADSSAVP